MPCEQLILKIEALIIETLNRKLSHSNIQMTSWDGSMRNRWIGLRIPSFTSKGDSSSQLLRKNCVWSPRKLDG